MEQLKIKIKEQRIKAGITQKSLADRLNVQQSTVSMWETGKAAPATKRLGEIASALGCGIVDLLA